MTKSNRLTIELTRRWRSDDPSDSPDVVRQSGPDPESSSDFAHTLAAAVFALRAAEGVWNNGEAFGGHDLVETAARFLALCAERELRPDGFWHFDGGDGRAEREGYGARLAAVRELLELANRYLETGDAP